MQISTNIYKGGGGVQKVQNLVYVENGCPLDEKNIKLHFFPHSFSALLILIPLENIYTFSHAITFLDNSLVPGYF